MHWLISPAQGAGTSSKIAFGLGRWWLTLGEDGCSAKILPLRILLLFLLTVYSLRTTPTSHFPCTEPVSSHIKVTLSCGTSRPHWSVLCACADIAGCILLSVQGKFEYWQLWLVAGRSPRLQSWFLSLLFQWYDRFHSRKALWARFMSVFPCCEPGIKSLQIAEAGLVNHSRLLTPALHSSAWRIQPDLINVTLLFYPSLASDTLPGSGTQLQRFLSGHYRTAFSQCNLSNRRLPFCKTQNGNMPGPLCGLRSQWSLGPNTETSALEKACVKADDSFCQDVEFFVVGEADCLDCLDKMFTEDKTAGLGMMNDVAHVRIY